MSFYVSTATFFLLDCDEWDRIVALPRHKFFHRSYIIAAIVCCVDACFRDYITLTASICTHDLSWSDTVQIL